MAVIKLTKGFFALIDDSDLEKAEKHKWHVKISRGKAYATRERRKGEYPSDIKVGTKILLHRYILGIHMLNGFTVLGDHRNGNSLDCRRSNLRAASFSTNGQNRLCLKSKKSSRYKGVCLLKNGHYQSYIKAEKRQIHIGTFSGIGAEIDAAKAYDVMAAKHFGEYAVLNFEPGGVPF